VNQASERAYLAIYLLTERQWAEDQIGFVMTIATVCGLIVQTPAGALTDASHAKRAIIVAAAVVVTGTSILLPFMSSFVLVAGSQAAADAAAAFFGPAIAAITLGIMGPRTFTRRIGATRASIMPAMRSRRRLREFAPGYGGQSSSSILSRAWLCFRS
jgi:MFS family permease